MTDLASLGLVIDSSQVPPAVGRLDQLTAAGARAEAATVGLGASTKGAAVQATAMAAAAQATARAATLQAAGFNAATTAAKVNTVAMRETLVVARELSRGNFSRIPGSLTLLAQGIGSQGGIKAFISSLTQTLGLVKTVQNAELAEEATNAVAAASAIQNAAERSAANIAAADTELALARAAVRTAEGSEAEAAAQVRLAAAHEAVAASASEAAIAENALAEAQGRAVTAVEASTAATTTGLSGLGVLLGTVAIAGGLAAAAFAGIKDAAEEADPSAQHLISTLGLTSKEVEKLKDTTVTWGDVAGATFDVVAKRAGTSASQVHGFFHEAFLQTAQVGVSAAQVILASFAAMVKGVHSLLGQLPGVALGILNPSLAGVATQGLGNAGADALNQFKKTFGDVRKGFNDIVTGANARRDSRVQDQANKLIGERSPSRSRAGRSASDAANDNLANEKAYQDLSARLDEQILQAKKALAGGIQEQADFAIQEINVQKDKTIADAKAMLAQHKITSGEEQHLELQAKQLADLKAQAVLRDAELAKMKAGAALVDENYQFQVDNLKFADQMATTQADHRRIQLEMLDIETQQKAAQLKALLAQEALANDWANYAVNAVKLFNLPQQQAQQAGLIHQNTLNPFEQWAKSVPQTAQAITEAFQGIEVNGIQRFIDGIDASKLSFKNLEQLIISSGQNIITMILQMTVKMLIFRAISSVFGGLFGGNNSFTTGLSGGAMSITTSANGNIFSGGNVIPFAGGGIVNSPTLFPMRGGKVGLMGEAGDEAIMPLTRDSKGRLGVRNDNQAGPIEVHVTVTASPELDARIQTVSAQQIGQAAPIIVKAAVSQSSRTMSRPKLMGGR